MIFDVVRRKSSLDMDLAWSGFQLSVERIRNCFGFVLLRSMIGLKLKLAPPTQPITFAIWSHAFSRAWRQLRVFA